MKNDIILQLSEVLFTLFEGRNKQVMQNVLQPNPDSDEAQIKDLEEFIKDIKFFIIALNRNRDLVKSLIPNIFQTVSDLSVFDVNLSVESKKIFSQIENLEIICKNLVDEFKNVAVSQEESQEALNQNSLLLKGSSDDAIKINSRMKDEMLMIGQVKDMLNELALKSDKMVEEVNDLLSINKQIAETISGIRTLANHTTLLALNASIEAARAGVAGKGFAVIAQEVRTLADNTKKLVTQINDLLSNVQNASNNNKESISGANASIKKIDETASVLFNNAKINSDDTQFLTENIQNVYTYSQHVFERTQNTADVINDSVEKMGNIYEIVQNIHESGDIIRETGVSFSETMDASGAKMTEISGNLMQTKQMGISNNELNNIIDKALAAHMGWINTLKDIVANMKLMPIQTNGQKCAFGHYYNAIMPVHSSVSDLWKSIGPAHKSLHEKGDLILECVEKGDRPGSERYLQEAMGNSAHIIRNLEEVMRVTKGLGVSVFKRG